MADQIMANEQKNTGLTIEKFLELYGRSNAAGLLPVEIKMSIDKAIAQQDMTILNKLYQILLREQETNKQIVSDFNESRNKIMERFMVTATDLRKRYMESPLKRQRAAAVEQEKAEAEKILNKIQ
jgi:hypothetical protein